jgi:hypothetical protein
MSLTHFWGLQYVDPTWMLVRRSADVSGKRKDGALRFRRAQRSRSQVAYWYKNNMAVFSVWELRGTAAHSVSKVLKILGGGGLLLPHRKLANEVLDHLPTLLIITKFWADEG